MNKKLLIGIIAGVVVVGAIIGGVFLFGQEDVEQPINCRHDVPEKIEIVPAKSPTCVETGLTEGLKCTICGTMVTPQAVIPKIECVEGDWIVDKEVTKTEDGKRHKECTMCGKTIIEEVLYATGSKGLSYTLNDDRLSYTVSRGSCNDTEIVIPKYHNGYSVTNIGDYAFYCCSWLTSITIPDSVTSIGSSAFSSCGSLTSITIPDSVTSIGSSVFSSCGSLTSITIPDSVTSIGSSVFSSCGSLTSITIPNSVTSIGYQAFYYCSSLTSIVIPDSVTSIGEMVFFGCASLTIYCEVESQPSGWGSYWNYSNRPVVWGYTGE